ncbi:DNA polymerase III subunit alpha [Altibacter sp. HG106]|uniref:DNA polymerase III subunit alpha n=1 Tax=Altibacter sp. HG106 TaxID=3023937 RepID=UPI0023501324|nr:DNA polymerase III subunit alpha [Altibacter sp. HG106]MDC7995413.1 DNA polymerase III subunit alpha [Altibacter sp. HG106]
MLLNCHTYYSLRFGTIAPRTLVHTAKAKGYDYLTLTDINNTSACWDMLRECQKTGIRAVLGIDFRNGAEQQFILLAKNHNGFQRINAYLSEFLHEKATIPPTARPLADTFVIYPFHNIPARTLAAHEFIGVRSRELNRLKFSPWRKQPDKLLALHTVSFLNKKGFNTHRLLRAIDNNTLLSKLPTSEEGSEYDVLISQELLQEQFREFSELLQNTERLLQQCVFQFDFESATHNNQRCFGASEAADLQLLQTLIEKGLPYRYGNSPHDTILKRVAKELDIIQKKGFVSYFLINWHILEYARSKGYYYVGRGSGANSVIAYVLRITDVDPIELDLYFERFINLYRKNPPDFDIDFSWADRDDVTAFIFKTFKHTALITVYNTFKYRAAVRELGKVFGLPKAEIDKLSAGHYRYEQLDRLSQLVITYSKAIEGFPNYLGIHASGIIISEASIHRYTATFMPPKGFPTTQFDMVVAEDIGLFKFDILSQRGLGKIKDAVQLVQQNHPNLPPIDIHDIKRFKQDERIKTLLREAKAIGCFYVESPAMRMLLRKLQVDDYLGLVAASSIIRPGVAKSGMMREYILRHRYPERREDAHPILLDIMPETYGVMVYQEDVIKVAHYFGGLDLGEADMLRRGMSGKFRSREEFNKVKAQFFQNCLQSGKTHELTAEIWRQIESFAGYAFAKGHSASYAVESYQSLFLKAYFPLEYMVATLNNGGGFYSRELYVHEARLHNGRIFPPCVNTSEAETVIQNNKIFLGLGFLKDLEQETMRILLKERKQNGAYESLDNFMQRVPIAIEQLRILIRIDAFRFTQKAKRALLWEAHMKMTKKTTTPQAPKLFTANRVTYQLPALENGPLEDAFDALELLGFPLCDPFLLLSEEVVIPTLQARELATYLEKNIRIAGYLVAIKHTKTSQGKPMYFGTFLDQEGAFIDTVHFPPVAIQYPFQGKGIYLIEGIVSSEFDCVSIEVTKMQRLPIIPDPRYAEGMTRTRMLAKRYKNKVL